LNWQESDLAARLRSDPGKLAIAARLRNETTLPIKWIAALVQIGTPKGAQAVLKGVLTIDATTARFGACLFRPLPFPGGGGRDVLTFSPG
jgi:hypothetical protein